MDKELIFKCSVLPGLILPMLLGSCVQQEYDVSNIDTTISIGGEALAFPLGSTEKLTLKTLLSEEDFKYITQSDDGVYEFSMSDGMDLSDRIPEIPVTVQPYPINRSIPLHFDNNEPSVTFNETAPFEMIDLSDIPAEVESIYEITFSGAQLSISMNVSGLPENNATARLDVDIRIPEQLIIEDSRLDADNVLHISETMGSDGVLNVGPITVRGLNLTGVDLSGNGMLAFDFTASGIASVENFQDITGEVTLNLSANIPEVSVAKVTGKINYSLTGASQTVDLSGLPDYLRGDETILDFAKPHILLSINSNIGIPFKGDVEILPYTGGQADESGKITIDNFAIPAAASASATRTSKYWIANTDSGMPSDYTFLQADIRGLMKKLPEKVDITVVGGTDMDSTDPHVLEFPAQYTLGMEYKVAIPFYFGENLNIVMRDTLDIGAGSDIADIFARNVVVIGGEVVSSLPLELELELGALDTEKTPIEIAAAPVQTIYACNPDGSPASTPLNLRMDLTQNARACDIQSLTLNFKITSPNRSNIPVTDESFVQAKLNLKVPGGISMNPAQPEEGDNN